MRRPTFLLFLLLMGAPAWCPAAMTLDKAADMPLPELASSLLGEAGAIMIDVDRPGSHQVLSNSIRFYSHATTPGSQFGLCAADWVTVHFDAAKHVDSLSSQRRYGVAGDIYRSTDWTYDDFGKLCASVASTRDYFPAPDPTTALAVAMYADAVAGKGPFASQNFSYRCTGACSPDRGDLKWLELGRIDSVRPIDCPKATRLSVCVEVTVEQSRVGRFPKVFDIYGTAWRGSVVISSIEVYVGSTLA